MKSLLVFLLFLLPVSALAAGDSEDQIWMKKAETLFGQEQYEAAIASYHVVLEYDPESAKAYFKLGLAHVQLQQYEEAFEAFEDALFIDPQFARAHYGLGIVYPLVMRDRKKAIEHFRQYLRLRPNASDADKVRKWIKDLRGSGSIKRNELMVELYNQGVEAYDRGEFELAAKAYQAAMERNPHYAPNHHALGLALVRIGRYHDAAEEFKETLQIDPRHVEAHYDLGIVYPVFKQFDKAIFHYSQYLKINPEASDREQVLDWIEKLKAKRSEQKKVRKEVALYNKAVDFYEAGKFPEAVEAYEGALAINKGMEDALHGLGLALIQLKKYREAYELLQNARRANPANPENYYSLGVLHTLLGDPVSGVASYERYLNLFPDAPDADKVEEWIEKLSNRLDVGFFNRGVEFYDSKRYEQALESFAEATAYNPKFDEAHRMVGFTYIQMKRVPEALAALNKALEIAPDSAETHYALGVAYSLAGKDVQSAEFFARYKESAPLSEDRETVNRWIAKLEAKTAVDLFNQGVDFYDLGEYNKAEVAYLESLALDATAPETHRALALIYIQQKDFAQAMGSLQNAREFGGESAENHFLYGVLSALKGNKEDSIEHYRRYTEMLPTAEDAEEIRAWIRRIEEKIGASLYNGGVDLYAQERYDEALLAFEKALELEPNAEATHRAIGMVALVKRDLAAAKESFNRALAIKGDSAETHYCLGVWNTLGGDLAAAVEHYEMYEQLIGIEGDSAHVERLLMVLKGHLADLFYNQGVVFYSLKQYERAEQNLEKAVGSNARFARAHCSLGLTQLQLKKMDAAKESLTVALELDPQDAETHYALGVLYGVLKEPSRAIHAYERYLELKPDAEDRGKVEEWIRVLQETAAED